MEIGGCTSHSAFNLCAAKRSATQNDIEMHADTRMNIIDEISFASYESGLGKASWFLQESSQCHEFQYGSAALCVLGDFCQLEAIQKDLIYKNSKGIYWEQSLNCLVELKGTHRYRHCQRMGPIMTEIRAHGLSKANLAILNERVIDGVKVKMPNPESTRFATFHNKNRCRINMDIFREHLKKHHSHCTKENIPDTALVIMLAETSWGNSKIKLSFDQRKALFDSVSEADCVDGRNKRIAPLSCLFHGSNQMVNDNKDVQHGIANGTTANFLKAVLKPAAKLVPIQMFGYWVYSVAACDVMQVEMMWTDSDRFQGKFRLSSVEQVYRVNFPVTNFGTTTRVKTSIQIEQFPILGNYATTGHKLQGKSLDELVIAEWSQVKNWAYVVLSRVRTLDGLYLTEPIPEDIDFSPHPENLDMMESLRRDNLATPINTADW